MSTDNVPAPLGKQLASYVGWNIMESTKVNLIAGLAIHGRKDLEAALTQHLDSIEDEAEALTRRWVAIEAENIGIDQSSDDDLDEADPEDGECDCVYCQINQVLARHGLHPHEAYIGVLRSIVADAGRKGAKQYVVRDIDEIADEQTGITVGWN